MKLIFELNPPKIEKNGCCNLPSLKESLSIFLKRAELLDGMVDGLHLTDSVLGIPRISGIAIASYLRTSRNSGSMHMSCSLRVRDRSFLSICQFVADSIVVGIKGVLIVSGDDSGDGAPASTMRPSEIVRSLHNMKYGRQIELDLAIPNHIQNSFSIQRKIDARPNAFVTQSIDSLDALRSIVEISHRNKIRVIACIMIPCEKNEMSARVIGLNWSEYKDSPIGFIKEAGRLADEVLLTSPNSFSDAVKLLEELRK
jgi:5,10-methylenetetrahydrofolate reductase